MSGLHGIDQWFCVVDVWSVPTDCVVVVLPSARLQAARSQRLLVVTVAVGQGRHDLAVPQSLDHRIDGAEHVVPDATEAPAAEQHMLRQVSSLVADQAECPRAPDVRAAGALRRRELPDLVQVLNEAKRKTVRTSMRHVP